MRVGGQSAIRFRVGQIVQNVDDARASHALRIVNARVLESVMLAKLRSALLRQVLHVVLGAEVQAAGRARLNAGGLQAHAHAVRAERTLVNLLSIGIEFRNVKGAAGNAISAADAMVLLEIDD